MDIVPKKESVNQDISWMGLPAKDVVKIVSAAPVCSTAVNARMDMNQLPFPSEDKV